LEFVAGCDSRKELNGIEHPVLPRYGLHPVKALIAPLSSRGFSFLPFIFVPCVAYSRSPATSFVIHYPIKAKKAYRAMFYGLVGLFRFCNMDGVESRGFDNHNALSF
jgi:hypothetical protein